MMDKKSFIIVLFLFFSVLIASNSHAQQGCCVYNIASNTFNQVCTDGTTQTVCSGAPGSTYRWEAGPLTCNTLPDKACIEACKICIPASGNTGQRYIWGVPATGCEQFDVRVGGTLQYNGIVTGPNAPQTEFECDQLGAPTIQRNLPNITGTVRDKDVTGTPLVVDAIVACSNGVSARTDSNGVYMLVGCSTDPNQVVSAAKGSKKGNSAPLSPSLGVEYPNINIEISAVTTKQITITVLNETNNAPLVADVTVITNASGVPQTKPTSSSGIATFVVKPEFITISVSKAGYAVASGAGLIDFRTKDIQEVKLRRIQTVQLSGYILGPATQPRVGQASIAAYVNNVLFGNPTSSNAQGFYSLQIPSSTQFKLIVSANTFQPRTIEPLQFNQNTEFNVTLQKITGARLFTINLTVLNGDNNNAPIQGVAVCQGQACDIYKTTNSSGKVIFRNLQEGSTYTFYAYHDDFSLQNNFKTVFMDSNKQETIILSEAPRMTVTGRVVDGSNNNNPIGGARVTLSDGSSATTSSTFGSEGTFTIPRRITPVPVTVFASKSGYLPNSDFTVQAGGVEGQITDLHDIALFTTSCSSPGNVGAIPLTASKDKNEISLNWNPIPCLEKTNGKIQIMRGIDGASLSPYGSPKDASSSFTDTNLESGKTYCYNVTVSYNFGAPTGIVEKSSLQKCFTIGPSVCFDDPDRHFCDTNGVRTQCINDGNNTQPIPCNSGEACLEFGNSAICLPANFCDYCNRPFGVFSSPGTSSIFGGRYNVWAPITVGTTTTQIQKQYFCNINDLGNPAAVACYLDASKTIVDKYRTCQNIKSCYDYVTREACEGVGGQNKCLPTTDCEWEPSPSYGELGIGVCRPENTDDQDCNQFVDSFTRNQANGIYNKIYASERGSVAREICSLYSDPTTNRCYYTTNPLRCLNQDETSCYDYEDEDSCTGGTPVNVNVTWITQQGIATMKRGDNRVLTDSNDLQGEKRCKWINTGQKFACVKDSDNATGYSAAGVKDNTNQPFQEDCLNPLIDREKCALDKTSPNTTFTYPSVTNEINFKYSAVDDQSAANDPSYQIKTYAIAVDPELLILNPYPTNEISNGILNIPSPVSGPNEPLALLYFSKDFAHNLEEVKRINLIVDTVDPGIEFSYFVDPDKINNKVDLYVNLKLLDDSLGYCAPRDLTSVGLKLNGEPVTRTPNLTSLGKHSANWSEVYRDIPTTGDTEAVYYWNCYDKAGNTAPEPQNSGPIGLDADGTISDPKPNAAVPTRTVPISIKTLYPGECRYADNDPGSILPELYRDWEPFTTTGNNAVNYNSAANTCNGLCEHRSTVTILANIYTKRYKVQCNLTNIPEPILGRNSDDIKITVDDIQPVTQPYIKTPDNKKINISIDPNQQFWTNGQQSLWLGCNDVYQDSNYPRESGCGAPGGVYYCNGQGLNIDCTPVNTQTANHQLSFDRTTSVKYYSVDKFGNEESVQPRIINFDNIAPIVTLNPPLDQTLNRTSLAVISLGGTIQNIGNPNEVSPLRSIYYKLEYSTPTGTVLATNGTLPPLSQNVAGESRLGILTPSGAVTNKTIQLVPNKVNILTVSVTDSAGNTGYPNPNGIRIVQDSLGPNLTGAKINGRLLSNPPNITFGTDLPVTITELLDIYPNTAEFPNIRLGLQERVGSVVVEDMFGAKYNLEKAVTGQGIEWRTDLNTRGWPITSPEFPTFIKIIATDLLGKKSEITVNIRNIDTLPPWVDYTLENSYGENVTVLTPGANFVVARASEPLKTLDMKFEVTPAKYTTQFFAHDFDSKVWTGTVNIATNNTPAITNGTITDSNNLISSDFRPEDQVSVRTFLGAEPLPLTVLGLINGVYYASSRDVQYLGIDETVYDYQYTINGKINNSLPIGAVVPGLNQGLNDVSIRVEDKINKFYKTYNQKVFADTSSPVVISYPSRTYTAASNLGVDFTESGSGIYNQTTRLVITNSTGNIVATVRLANSALRRIPIPSLPAGTYYVNTLEIKDLAGNQNEGVPEFRFRINPNAPTLTFTSPDLNLTNGIYYTNKQNPAITASFSAAVSSPTISMISGGVSASSPPTLASTGTNTYTSTDTDLASNGYYALEIRSGDDFWIYPIIKDETPPSFEIFANDFTNGNPLTASAVVTDGEKTFSQGTLLFDNAVKHQLNDISSNDGIFTFTSNLGTVTPGTHQVSIILKDRLGQETRKDKTVTVDSAAPVITARPELSGVQNLSGVLTTRQQTLTLSGSYADDDVSEIYVIGKDNARYDAVIDRTNKQYAIPDVRLLGITFTETRNDLILVFKDSAGNTAQKTITTVKDLKPPDLVELLFIRVFS